MKKSKVTNGIGFIFAFLLGMLIASYCPLPNVNVAQSQLQPTKRFECPVGFATLKEMSSLVEELRICKELKNESR